MTYSDPEKEAINLNAIIETLDSMINHENFEVAGRGKDTNISFQTSIHQKYFNILMVDFLSPIDDLFSDDKKSAIAALEDICHSPSFNNENTIGTLNEAVNSLKSWLDEEIEVEAWLPSVQTQATLKLRRLEFIKICGNISKHNYTRLTITARMLNRIYKRNGVDFGLEEALLSLDDFYERFHVDIFNYHSSAIAEMLNNIRWGIQEYLLPEYMRAKEDYWDKQLKIMSYKFDIPSAVETKFGQECYWDMMNAIRSGPYVERFEVTKYLKLRY